MSKLIDLAQDSQYQDATAKLAKLHADQRADEARVDEIAAQLASLIGPRATSSAAEKADLDAYAMLDAGPVADSGGAELRRELNTLNERRRVRSRAIEIQSGRIQAAQNERSKAAVAAYRPDHFANLVQYIRALVEASRAETKQRKLIDDLEQAGVSTAAGLTPIYLGLGDVADVTSRVNDVIREAIDLGAMTGSETWVADCNWRGELHVPKQHPAELRNPPPPSFDPDETGVVATVKRVSRRIRGAS